MITVVYGCFGCAGEEDPYYTCTIMYKDQNGEHQLHWLCRSCVSTFTPQRIADGLTHTDMHPDAQETFDGTSPCRDVETITQGLQTAA